MAVFKLHNYPQAHQMILDLMPRIKTRLQSGNVLTLTITEDNRSLDQNAMFHALIGQIAKQAQHMGAHWDTETWKRLLCHEWAKETGRQAGQLVASLDGKDIVQLGIQTRKFSKQEASEFTEWVLAWGSQNGITFKE
jgi:hypothetical protein